MVALGFTLSSEEHPGSRLVRLASEAERAGFSFVTVSDHFHPWTSTQGQSPFVWSVLGGIAASTERLRVGTTVTCPLIRIHPAIVAQAAATIAEMMPHRFFLGLGTGEHLNEHVTGERWPAASERREMLAEAIGVIRELWKGDDVNHVGRHYRVVNARVYTRPDEPPPVYVAAAGPKAARMAAELGDGLIATAPDEELLGRFDDAGGRGKPRLGQLTVCWASDERQAHRTALEWWPNAALKGQLGQELPLPRHFEQAAELVTEDRIAEAVVCGPDPERHAHEVRAFADAGFDLVAVHQVGPDPEGGLRFYAEQVVPRLEVEPARISA
jgi:coenzyme F420-dependent glucose-6-phosphate dehydrogenase